MSYPDVFVRSLEDPEGFWLDAAGSLEWERFPQVAHDAERDHWFADGLINTCVNAVDRHVLAGRGDQPAL
ncbi:MAG: propionyl-CoA synthetase, partial [Novosphingobium sp.]|nr:propionyl-CoA synthetase [Novosphingobium sp.]